MSVKVLFVCLGNICRSPTAHGVFESLVNERGLQELIAVDSAGTGDWHLGAGPDKRALAAAKNRGYDLSALRARQVIVNDFDTYDFIMAMDNNNLDDLRAMSPARFSGELALFLHYTLDLSLLGDAPKEVPDPYYGSGDGFEHVLDLVEDASKGLLEHILKQHRL